MDGAGESSRRRRRGSVEGRLDPLKEELDGRRERIINLKMAGRKTPEKIVHIAITTSLVDVRDSEIITTGHTFREESCKDFNLVVSVRCIKGANSSGHLGGGDSDWGCLAVEAEGGETSENEETKSASTSTNIIAVL